MKYSTDVHRNITARRGSILSGKLLNVNLLYGSSYILLKIARLHCTCNQNQELWDVVDLSLTAEHHVHPSKNDKWYQGFDQQSVDVVPDLHMLKQEQKNYTCKLCSGIYLPYTFNLLNLGI